MKPRHVLWVLSLWVFACSAQAITIINHLSGRVNVTIRDEDNEELLLESLAPSPEPNSQIHWHPDSRTPTQTVNLEFWSVPMSITHFYDVPVNATCTFDVDEIKHGMFDWFQVVVHYHCDQPVDLPQSQEERQGATP